MSDKHEKEINDVIILKIRQNNLVIRALFFKHQLFMAQKIMYQARSTAWKLYPDKTNQMNRVPSENLMNHGFPIMKNTWFLATWVLPKLFFF